MDCDNAFERPAGEGLTGHSFDLGFRHTGIVLDFERRERTSFVTAKPGESNERTNIAAPVCQTGGFR